ncbi:DUF4229 domain-containing protein [Cellulomonas alba]|uniref:DUF4229 domain-containing protein n=1 Tax=Cellulomonas alba TaxID=3053467 RepID=A0ABT7SFY5_9CELL|nr:DUF4229 domain-containing protein [Cellulomonas alba]MDM7854414.1 DUF4229 domain-containing protein [Cellulomonas alba]
MRLAVYSLLRLGLFAVCLGVLYLVGMRSFLLVVVAALVAWGLSYVLLGRWRDAAASQLAEAAERRKALGGRAELTGKAREQADLEDAADEAARASDVADAAPGAEDASGTAPAAGTPDADAPEPGTETTTRPNGTAGRAPGDEL